jgi:hypothetical protein
MAHGGYFLGRRDGGVTTAFLRHLQRRHVVRLIVGRRGTFLYHVYPKRLYALIDEIDSRNRRVVMPARVVRKLMTLDLVLGDRSVIGLETEDEKVAYLTATAGLQRSALPGTWYPQRGDPFTGTVRHFVDKPPREGTDGRRVTACNARPARDLCAPRVSAPRPDRRAGIRAHPEGRTRAEATPAQATPRPAFGLPRRLAQIGVALALACRSRCLNPGYEFRSNSAPVDPAGPVDRPSCVTHRPAYEFHCKTPSACGVSHRLDRPSSWFVHEEVPNVAFAFSRSLDAQGRC